MRNDTKDFLSEYAKYTTLKNRLFSQTKWSKNPEEIHYNFLHHSILQLGPECDAAWLS